MIRVLTIGGTINQPRRIAIAAIATPVKAKRNIGILKIRVTSQLSQQPRFHQAHCAIARAGKERKRRERAKILLNFFEILFILKFTILVI
jgi:hypothetical protein